MAQNRTTNPGRRIYASIGINAKTIAFATAMCAFAGNGFAQSTSTASTSAAPGSRPNYASTDDAATVLKTFDLWAKRMADQDSLSGVVAIAYDGKIISQIAAGIADEPNKTPNTANTRLTLASMGKMFTAMSIAQLVDQHKVSLTDTVGKFLPDYPNATVVHKVTVAQLLNHTSGFGLFWNARYAARHDSLFTLKDYLPLFSPDTLLFAPGARFEYSNNGYIMLGRIIEVASGISYYDYVQKYIFDVAGMHNTGFYDKQGRTPGGAIGYSRPRDGSSGLVDNLGIRELRGASAGGGYSTAADMLAFMHAVHTNKLASQATTKLFTTGNVNSPFGPNGYGYGFITRVRVDTVVGHTGGFQGMTNAAYFFPNSKYAVVVLTNRDADVSRPILQETTRVGVTLASRQPIAK